MRKTFCDKCGKEITTDVEWVFNHELCPECAKAVDVFITHPSRPSIVDVQPVKHGRWIIADDVEHFIAVCSECGRTEDSRDIKYMPYCHCGARMDGDTNG